MMKKIIDTVFLSFMFFALLFSFGVALTTSTYTDCSDKYIIDITGTVTGYTEDYKANCM